VLGEDDEHFGWARENVLLPVAPQVGYAEQRVGVGGGGARRRSLSSIALMSCTQVLSNPTRCGSGGKFTSRKIAKGLSFGFWASAS
jgi:hypothetical protein